MLDTIILNTELPGIEKHAQGKVRDVYQVDGRLLIVATDRISAFDYVLPSGIPDKGKGLRQISAFWFERAGGRVAHHMLSLEPTAYPEGARAAASMLGGRSMLVKRTDPLPIECVA